MKQFVFHGYSLLHLCLCVVTLLFAPPPSLSFERYNLGPNGGILTCLNLFTTKFDQVLDLVEKRADSVE